MTRDWWEPQITGRTAIWFNADHIHADLTHHGDPRIQLDDGRHLVTIYAADAAALTELHNLIGILLDQLDTTRP